MAEGTSGASAGRLVLVCDDEVGVRDLVCEILDEAGFRTMTAADGAEVLDLTREHEPALIVLDVLMPGMDGYTALARLRGHPMTLDVPVIILTGQSDPMYRTLSEGIGAVAHLTKPFSPGQLLDTVQQVLGAGAS